MSKQVTHRVRQGECVQSIAAAYGVADWRAVYDDAKNAELKKRRPNPNELAPGDLLVLQVPEPEPLRFESGSTQSYKVNLPTAPLRLFLTDPSGQAMSGKPYKIRIGKKVYEGTVPDDGVVEHQVSATATAAVLEIDLGDAIGGKAAIPIRIGHLDPLSVISGVQGRLQSLGFPAPSSGKLDDATRAAIALFQAKIGRTPTGELDDETRAALGKRHRNQND